MKCPIDQTDLAMTERQGVEIDYCPQCRGVWLDRGELDKIIERAEGIDTPSAQSYQEPINSQRRDDRRDDYNQSGYQRKRKKEGFLGDLFDFGG